MPYKGLSIERLYLNKHATLVNPYILLHVTTEAYQVIMRVHFVGQAQGTLVLHDSCFLLARPLDVLPGSVRTLREVNLEVLI